MHTIHYYAADLTAHTEHVELPDAVHFGHSSWGGDVGHQLARHGGSVPHGMPAARADAVSTGLRS